MRSRKAARGRAPECISVCCGVVHSLSTVAIVTLVWPIVALMPS